MAHMDGRYDSTIMIHLACGSCSMNATMVETPTGRQAWKDHMATHNDRRDFRQWVWYVVPLPLELEP